MLMVSIERSRVKVRIQGMVQAREWPPPFLCGDGRTGNALGCARSSEKSADARIWNAHTLVACSQMIGNSSLLLTPAASMVT